MNVVKLDKPSADAAQRAARSSLTGPLLLTIGVPTFNRRPYLQRCVDSILDSISRCDANVELLISDNASGDDTPVYLAELADRVRSVRVIRQVENIGAERNFRALTKQAAGRFIWIVGDDDCLEPGAVALVVCHLRDGATCLVCNYSIWDKDLTRVIATRGLRVKKDVRVRSKDAVMRLFGLNLGYISSVVISRALFTTLSDGEYEAFSSYGFPFMYAAFAGLSMECELQYISTPIVINRSGNSGGYDWYRYFVRGSSLIFERLVHEFGYRRLGVNIAKTRVIHQYVVRELVARRLNGDGLGEIPRLLIASYWYLPSFWLLLLPAMVLPRRLLAASIRSMKQLRQLA